MRQAHITKKINPHCYRTVAVFSTSFLTWCGFESHTSYKPTKSHVNDLLHIGEPLSLEEVKEAFSGLPRGEFLKLESLGKYWEAVDNILPAPPSTPLPF